jgi:hypothetical protein
VKDEELRIEDEGLRIEDEGLRIEDGLRGDSQMQMSVLLQLLQLQAKNQGFEDGAAR